MNYQPRSMLVTGGAGFIGANFIRYVLDSEPVVQIVNLDKLTYAGSLDNLRGLDPERYHFIQGDICDGKLVRDVLQHHHIDTIVHFAAESHVDRSIAAPDAFMQTNILGTFTLLEAAREHWFNMDYKGDAKHCRFHHISTDEVFGSLQPHDAAFIESTRFDPRSPYSASKAGADHLVNAYYHTYGLPVTLSNCSNNYGPYQHPEKFIPTVIRSCLNKTPIPVYGNGQNIRDWLYVEDHCRAVMMIIKRGKVGDCYNIGGNNEQENLALAEYICKQMDELRPGRKSHTGLIKFVTDRPGHDFRYAIDGTKIKQELGWEAKETLKSGMKKTLEFYLGSAKSLGERVQLADFV